MRRMNDDALINDIFLLFPMVRYAAIWQNNSKICGGMRDNLKSYFPEETEKISILRQISRWVEDNELDKLGEKRYNLIVNAKARLYTIGMSQNKFLMISTEPDEIGDGLINSILELDDIS
jgi:hypothetical protein